MQPAAESSASPARKLRRSMSVDPADHQLFEAAEQQVRRQAPSKPQGWRPARITPLSTMAMPRKMNSPSPPAPMAAAMVATPMVITAATRMPASITGNASGSSTCQQQLARSEAHGDRRLAHWRADAGNPHVGIANHRQQRVESERDDRQTICTSAQPRQRQQQSEERETGNGLHYVGAAQHKRLPLWTARQQDSQRHSDKDGQQHGNSHQPQVFGGQGRHFAFMGEEEVQTISRAFDRGPVATGTAIALTHREDTSAGEPQCYHAALG